MNDPRNEQVIDLMDEIFRLLRARTEAGEVSLSAMMAVAGTILGNFCHTETSLLRAITMNADVLRSIATDTFVEKQRRRVVRGGGNDRR